MGKAVPAQHPAVVLRSHYRQVKAMLAIAMVAVVGLSAAVVIVANDVDVESAPDTAVQFQDSPATHAHPKQQPGVQQPRGTRYDGGPEEGSRGVLPARQPGVRYDGGPEEGAAALTHRSAPATFDPNSIKSPPGVRYDGGPEEGSRGALSSDPPSNAVPGTRYDGGPEEGSRGSGR